ncbi:MAG: 50S ribosomal protein L29 [Saprospiraceae bacterium]
MAKEKLNLAEMDNDTLVSELASMQNDLTNMKFDHAVKGLANPMELRELRRNVARIHTEMRSRELATMSAEELALRSKLRARRRRQR